MILMIWTHLWTGLMRLYDRAVRGKKLHCQNANVCPLTLVSPVQDYSKSFECEIFRVKLSGKGVRHEKSMRTCDLDNTDHN